MPGTVEPLILRTKLHPPRLDDGRVVRPRLLGAFTEHRDSSCLTLVTAPAGYGKSILVAEWTAADSRPAAWVCLDDSDNDLRVFLKYVVAAVESMYPESCPVISSLIGAPELPPVRVLAGQFANEVDAIGDRFILVLDDYHEIRETAIHDLLSELLRHPPENLHWMIATRRDPALPLATLRASQLMTEIRFDDLRFSQGEAAELMERNCGQPFSAAALSRVEDITEGWAAGIQLVALAARHKPNPEAFLLGLSGSIREIQEYLVAEVVARQSPEFRQQLLKTAILERFCAPLCEAIFQDADQPPSDGAQWIRELIESELFVVPLDSTGEYFRFHHLFRDLLREQLRKEFGPDELAEIHDRASGWFAENEWIDEALQHSLAAGNLAASLQLVARHRHKLINREDWGRLERWLRAFPTETIEQEPVLQITRTWIAEFEHRYSECWTLLQSVEQQLASASGSAAAERAGIEGEIDTLRALKNLHELDGEKLIEAAERALKKLPPEAHSIRGFAVILLTYGQLMLGRRAEALANVYGFFEEGRDSDPVFQVRALASLFQVHWFELDLNGMRQAATQCLEIARKSNLPDSVIHSRLVLGIVHYLRDELDEAEGILSPVIEQAMVARTLSFSRCAFVLALVFSARGQSVEASALADKVIHRALKAGDPQTIEVARAFEAELALHAGKLAEASAWASKFDPGPIGLIADGLYVPRFTLVRVLVTEGTPASLRRAAKELSLLEAYSRATSNDSVLVRVLADQALVSELSDDQAGALSKLSKALELAEPGGGLRFFLDLGEPMRASLNRLPDDRQKSSFVRELLSHVGEQGDAKPIPDLPGPKKTQPLIEPLTNRELDVLELVAERLYDKEIAARLSISPGTVKSHLKHIYRKLDVGKRREAVAQAKALGII